MTRRQYNRLDLPKHKNLCVNILGGVFSLFVHTGTRFPVMLKFPLRRIYDIYMDDGYLYILESPDKMLAALDKALWENVVTGGFKWVNCEDEDTALKYHRAKLPLGCCAEIWLRLIGGWEWQMLDKCRNEVLSGRGRTFEEAKHECETMVTAKLDAVFEYQRGQYALWKGDTQKEDI